MLNLKSLLERAKSGSYWAPPVRRSCIPKGDGKETRPLGIPTLEDKLLQRAVVMALDLLRFLACSSFFIFLASLAPGRFACRFFS